MQTYKIHNNTTAYYKNFASLQDAQDFADSLGLSYIATLAPENEQIPEEDITTIVDDKTEQDFKFGSYLLQLFVADNRRFEKAYNTSITKEQTDSLILAYEKLINYCTIGAINELAVELAGITPNEVFTQERKDKYQALVTSYLQNS